jgi:Phage capsid protein
MSQQIDTALVQSYRSNIEIQFQQKGSRLRNTVRTETQHAEFDFYDRIGPVTASLITTRGGDTQYSDTPFDRRRIGLQEYDFADLIDKFDKLRMLADPTSSYTQNAVFALGRAIDNVIITAGFGTAYTGKTGATSVNFNTTTNQIAANYVEAGTAANTNLTIAKLRKAKFILQSQEAIEDGEMCYAAVTASQIQSLLRTTEVTNADYNSIKALVSGEIDTFMGFKFVRLELLPKTGNIRNCMLYPQSGITLAMAEDIVVEVDRLPGKRYSVQVYVRGSFGASRMWEAKVVSVLCDETT